MYIYANMAHLPMGSLHVPNKYTTLVYAEANSTYKKPRVRRRRRRRTNRKTNKLAVISATYQRFYEQCKI